MILADCYAHKQSQSSEHKTTHDSVSQESVSQVLPHGFSPVDVVEDGAAAGEGPPPR